MESTLLKESSVHYTKQQYRRAVELAVEHERQNGADAESAFLKGRALLKLGEIAPAKEAFDHSLGLRETGKAYRMLVTCLERMHQFDDLCKTLNRILDLYQSIEFLKFAFYVALRNGIDEVVKRISKNTKFSIIEDLQDGHPRVFGLTRRGEIESNWDKKALFVSGAPRSGTTALGRLLNIHPRICLLVEQYCNVPYHPSMFSKELLIDKRLWEGHQHYARNERLVRQRLESSRYVGDKRPLFERQWGASQDNFRPDQIRIIHITRHPLDVVSSYKARYDDLDDKWARTPLDGALEWNENAKFILRMSTDLTWSASFLHVRYEDIFASESEALRVWEWLGLDTDWLDRKQLSDFIAKSQEILMRGVRPPHPEVVDACESTLDTELMVAFGYNPVV